MCVAVVRNSSELEYRFNHSEREIVAASFSALGPIFLGHRQKQKQAQKGIIHLRRQHVLGADGQKDTVHKDQKSPS